MAMVSMDLDMKRVTNEEFLKKANDCMPVLKETLVHPSAIVKIQENESSYPDVSIVDSAEHLSDYPMKKGDKLYLDFGGHQVGSVTLRLSSTGSPQDSPAYFRLKFGEIAREMAERSKDYDGWISRSWIQEEFIHIDVLPAELKLPRRYAFRYMEIEVIDTSLKWQMVVDEVTCTSVSAVDPASVQPYQTQDELLQKIDRAGIRTLQNCMQLVFEDGPKRDRRLWIGDLRLQALANYATFRHYGLVKRCLYLFAAQTREDGRVSACLFTEPKLVADDTFFADYSLFFAPILLDYYEETKDIDTLRDLAPCAYRQVELVRQMFDEQNLIQGEGSTPNMWCFIDWTEGLDKQAAAQAVYIYCEKRAQKIAEILGDAVTADDMGTDLSLKSEAAFRHLWDNKMQLFVSGTHRQVSYASQVWMVLAEVVDAEAGGKLLDRVTALNPEKGMVSPYMNHHFTEALLMCGRKEKALEYMKFYWGGMIRLGADTFWELYNPQNPSESPYGSSIVNSYCHAWSCTPAYLLRKYF